MPHSANQGSIQSCRMRVLYLLSRYPLWSETFIRQDMRLLQTELPEISFMALFAGDCPLQPDWPQVQILCDQPRGQDSSKTSRNKLRRLIPGALQARLVLFKYRRILRELSRQARLQQVRHIHAEFADLAAFLGMHAAQSLGLGFSFGVHAADVYANQYSLSALVQGAKFINSCNLAVSDYLAEKHPLATAKLHLIHHGLLLEDWPYRREDSLQKPLRLCFAGRFVPKKGIGILLRSCAILQSKGLAFHLRLAGDGPLGAELRRLADELGIGAQCHWLGQLSRPQVKQLMLDSDILCLPSIKDSDNNQEGVPNVLVEAMALGLPALGSQSGSIAELLTAETGWPLTEINPETLAQGLEEIINSPQQRQKRRLAARRQVEKEFCARENGRRRAALLRQAAI
ncbi:MAG: glycosyltransferase family 4 protein [Lentisphaeria bacterium]|nr:glycosyltransferase family 4 protein [Lentisphaeria bacterium]